MNHQQMSQLAQDPARLRSLAFSLLTAEPSTLSMSARNFLTDLTKYTGNLILSGGGKEWLWDLMKSKSRTRTTKDGRGQGILLETFAHRADIPDHEDEETLIGLHSQWQFCGLSKHQWVLVCQVARQIGVISKGEWIQV